MSTPNYRLALALAMVGWTNSETARRINHRALCEGHSGIAVDHSRVSRWIRLGERPRRPVPELLAALVTDHLGELHTPQSLGIAPARSVRIPLEDDEFRHLVRHAGAANMPVEIYAQALLRSVLSGKKRRGPPNFPPIGQ
ncbi:hypothetical protein [Streptomyces sp. NPDC059787]|uniref:hypothetical protein n=1 Tax=Streptomyces sp. NPDC059787 TaxID=3346947 RepID=UPI003648E2F4